MIPENTERPKPGRWVWLAENVPAAGWVAALLVAGLLLGTLVAMYDANSRPLGFVIVIYCCVYGGVYFTRWYDARYFRGYLPRYCRIGLVPIMKQPS